MLFRNYLGIHKHLWLSAVWIYKCVRVAAVFSNLFALAAQTIRMHHYFCMLRGPCDSYR